MEYIKDKKIISVTDADKKTPAGNSMVTIVFEDGGVETMPKVRFNLVKKEEITDASAMQLTVRKAVGSAIYSVMHEYGLTLAETNNVLDEAATLMNAASDKAMNILFGVEYPEDRTVTQINDILLEHANKSSDNETASAGSGADSTDSQ